MGPTAVPHQLVKFSFQATRLPLTVAQMVGSRVGVDVAGWPPVQFYDTVEAYTKRIVGQAMGDHVLVEEGEHQLSAQRHRAGAEHLAARAEQVRAEAAEKRQEKVSGAQSAREKIGQKAAERKDEIEREEQQAKQEAAERARQREQAVSQAAKTREKAVEAKERQADLARVKAEREALEKQGDAVDAEKTVATLDKSLEERKAARNGHNS